MTAAITDFSQYTGLRRAAEQNDPAALREVASQFEALFLQSMLKSMRDASLGDALIGNSDQYELYQGMMDEQLALEMASGKGIGLAEMLVRQLGGENPASSLRPAAMQSAPRSHVADVKHRPDWADPVKFARDIWPHAARAARQLNVAPEAVVAQAALETGWGAHVMPDKNGDNSFNLFGIKAGSGWQGDRVSRATLEFDAGIPRRESAQFRAYGDVAASFRDYTEFLAGNPRYVGVRNHGSDAAGFAAALQDSGYATDPNYAEKIKSILDSPTMRRVIAEQEHDVTPRLKGAAVPPITGRLSAFLQ